MFSFVRTGTVCFDAEIDPAALPIHLADCLRRAQATTIVVQGNRVAFTRRILRLVSNWNVLVPFESGDLTVDAHARQVRYRVSFRQLVLFGTAAVGLMTAVVVISSVWQPLLVIPLMWLWLVGGNLIVGIVRFEAFVGRAITSAPHSLPVQSRLSR